MGTRKFLSYFLRAVRFVGLGIPEGVADVSFFNKRIKLPHYVVVSTELMPEKPGEYTFECGKGKLKGKLVVEQ